MGPSEGRFELALCSAFMGSLKGFICEKICHYEWPSGPPFPKKLPGLLLLTDAPVLWRPGEEFAVETCLRF